MAELGTPGRLKLLVTLPSEGGIGVVDVQDLLDRESGTSDPCVIERWLPLEVELTPPPPPPPPQGEACVPPETGYVDPAGAAFEPMPDGVALAGGRLYVADRNAPVIHRLQVDDPCDPHEIPPLVTSSAEDPLRVVVTSEVAVSPLTLDLRRFLYAVDLYDGSIMVYDVSDEGGSTRPLERPNAATNPFQPRDRLFFGSPPRELVTVRQQRDDEDPVTGSTVPLRCDPDPEASGPATEYRTTSDYSDAGASPFKLRGVFTLAVLESGEIFVLDVDDFDAPCRGPQNQTLARGCEEPLESGLVTSDEYSCRTVSPHEPRAGAFLFSIDGIADREPGVNAFPLLFSSEGTVIQLDAEEGTSAPRMRALTGVSSRVRVGSSFVELDTEGLAVGDPTEHTLVMNLADPRAHIVDQDWTVTYEGGLPGFGGRFAELVETEAGFTMTEPTSSFCGRGVQSLQALADRLAAPPPEGEGLSEAEAVAQASPFADYVQIFSDFPVESDGYWDAQSECTFNACNAVYGSTEAPREARDLRIVEAYQDAVELEPRVSPPADAPRLKCCLPGVVEFRVRPGRQWTVVGSTVRFLHRMTTAEDGTCRPSCDPISALENARVREAAAGASVSPDDPAAFINPFFQLAINAGDSQRDMQFRFTTKGSFEPLVLTVRTEETADIQPSAATFLSLTGELVVSDGSLQGITFIDLDDLRITRQLN